MDVNVVVGGIGTLRSSKMPEHLSLKTCQALKAVGYSPDLVGQCVWIFSDPVYGEHIGYATHYFAASSPYSYAAYSVACEHGLRVCRVVQLLACPDPITALDWLEQEKGYFSGMDYQGIDDEMQKYAGRYWWASKPRHLNAFHAEADTPDDLILAVIEDMEEVMPYGEHGSN